MSHANDLPPMFHIVVTTDLSPESTIAFGHALQQYRFREKGTAQITVVHCLENIVDATFGLGLGVPAESIIDDLQRRAEERLEQFRRHFFTGVIPLSAVIRCTQPVAIELTDFARGRHADLIVVASHGRSGFSHALFGSVAERMVRATSCPLMIIPVTKEAVSFVREQAAEFWK